MRNLIIASVVLASASSLLFYQRGGLASQRRAIAVLASETDFLPAKNEALKQAVGELGLRLREQARQISQIREQAGFAKAALFPSPSKPDPAGEGHWPAQRPYFYLPKDAIRTLAYNSLNAAGQVSGEAAALFAMTRPERLAIDQALSAVYAGLRRAELASAYLTNTPPSVAKQREGIKISVYLPPAENLDSLSMELRGQIQSILGPERFPLFMENAKEMVTNLDNFSREPRVVTILPKDDLTGEIITSTGHGSSFNYYDRTQPMNWLRLEYDHLLDRFLAGAR